MTTTNEVSKALATVGHARGAMVGIKIETFDDLQRFSNAAAKSGYFKETNDIAQAIVKIHYGMELGISPIAALQGLYTVDGRPAMSAALMASIIKRSGRYNFRIVKHDDTECVIDFYEGNLKCGTSSFTIKDAERAKLVKKDVWEKYPRNMLFARALANGARWNCADLFLGPIYTAEELGGGFNRDEDMIIVEDARRAAVIDEKKAASIVDGELAAPAPSPSPATTDVTPADPPKVTDDERPTLLAVLRAMPRDPVERAGYCAARRSKGKLSVDAMRVLDALAKSEDNLAVGVSADRDVDARALDVAYRMLDEADKAEGA